MQFLKMRAQARTGLAVIIVWLALHQLHQSLQLEGSANAPDAEDNNVFIKPVKGQRSANSTKTIDKFLGMHLGFVFKEARSSVVHCVGDNFLPKTSSGYRSCQFRHICWDLDRKDFVIFESPQHQRATELQKEMGSMYVRSSFDFNTTVSTSATTEGRLRQGLDGNWFPRTVPMDPMKGFYELPQDIVLVPVEFPEDGSMSRKDVLFDFFLPVYNLLAMFDLQGKQPLLVNLSPSCSTENGLNCYGEVTQFLPLMNKDASLLKEIFMTINDQIAMPPGETSKYQSNLICAKYGAAGIGALTDHGIHKMSHGERRKDYTFVQNSGRGPLLFNFRNHLLSNMGIKGDRNSSFNNDLPLKVTVSVSESKKSRVQYFQKQIEAFRATFPSDQLSLESYNMSTLPLTQQLKIATETSIYISVMGEGVLPAFFLPRGATLIIFYNDNSEFASVSKRETTFPVKLDWDLWNNLGYVHVHWLPLGTKNKTQDLDVLLKIVEDEIDWNAPVKHASSDATNSEQAKQSDGTFNGMNVNFVKQIHTSRSHCMGDNFQQGAHVLKSCEFHHMCLDLSQQPRNFSLVASNKQSELMTMVDKSASVSTNMMSAVSLGQTIRFHEGSGWFPVVSKEHYESYYELSSDMVWIPFYAEQPNIHNPGHLLWDYFLPFFNLLAMFGLEGHRVLLSNVDDACTQEEEGPCWKIITKFLPLLGADSATFRNTKNSELKLKAPQRSNVVCAKKSVVGIGMLTDHGWNRHGQRIEDYRDVHNIGRGPLFFAFRNYVIHNMGIREQDTLQRPHKVVFSKLSSKNPARRTSFEKQVLSLRSSFSSDEVTVEGHVLSKMPLQEQVKLATETTVFISVVGGSACIGTFLPRGSTIILFFNDVGGEFVDHATRKDFPSMIDWDFWNNASHLRVHWLPISTMEKDSNLQALTELIRSDISTFDDVH